MNHSLIHAAIKLPYVKPYNYLFAVVQNAVRRIVLRQYGFVTGCVTAVCSGEDDTMPTCPTDEAWI